MVLHFYNLFYILMVAQFFSKVPSECSPDSARSHRQGILSSLSGLGTSLRASQGAPAGVAPGNVGEGDSRYRADS